jgi:hypothetical protein
MKPLCRELSMATRIVLLSGAILAPKSRAAENPPTQTNPSMGTSIALSPVEISAKPFGCFGMSIRAEKDGLTSRVSEMTVLEVVPNSDADKCGLAPLTRILSIDGKDVSEFAASFNQGSELNEKLISRKRGDRVMLEVLVLGAKKSRIVFLTEGRGTRDFPHDSDSEYDPPGAIHVGVAH